MNSLINKLPFELYISGCQYCGPGTKPEKRVSGNDPGINLLERACKDHDIAYATTASIEGRNKDEILEKAASERVTAPDTGRGKKWLRLV